MGVARVWPAGRRAGRDSRHLQIGSHADVPPAAPVDRDHASAGSRGPAERERVEKSIRRDIIDLTDRRKPVLMDEHSGRSPGSAPSSADSSARVPVTLGSSTRLAPLLDLQLNEPVIQNARGVNYTMYRAKTSLSLADHSLDIIEAANVAACHQNFSPQGFQLLDGANLLGHRLFGMLGEPVRPFGPFRKFRSGHQRLVWPRPFGARCSAR